MKECREEYGLFKNKSQYIVWHKLTAAGVKVIVLIRSVCLWLCIQVGSAELILCFV